MTGREQVSHRPGLLKQQNKNHKHGRHRSKSELDKNNKGIVLCLTRKMCTFKCTDSNCTFVFYEEFLIVYFCHRQGRCETVGEEEES